jgi:hypothetical protein
MSVMPEATPNRAVLRVFARLVAEPDLRRLAAARPNAKSQPDEH